MSTRTALTLATLALVTLASACGDDKEEADLTRDEWCALADDIDDQFSAADNLSAPFAERQAAYGRIGAGLRELAASIDVVDADSRAAVSESIGWAVALTDAVVAAESDDALADDLFGENGILADEPDPAGAAWILEKCGVDIDG